MSWMLRTLVLAALTACNVVYQLDDTHLFDDSPRRLVLDNSAATVDLVDFPVAVVIERTQELRITDQNTQLRFTDPVTAESLPFDIDTWTPTGASVVWVRVPRIPAHRRPPPRRVPGAHPGALRPPTPRRP